jgi:hypothetical protein
VMTAVTPDLSPTTASERYELRVALVDRDVSRASAATVLISL